jgi:hypothetical protein
MSPNHEEYEEVEETATLRQCKSISQALWPLPAPSKRQSQSICSFGSPSPSNGAKPLESSGL